MAMRGTGDHAGKESGEPVDRALALNREGGTI